MQSERLLGDLQGDINAVHSLLSQVEDLRGKFNAGLGSPTQVAGDMFCCSHMAAVMVAGGLDLFVSDYATRPTYLCGQLMAIR